MPVIGLFACIRRNIRLNGTSLPYFDAGEDACSRQCMKRQNAADND